MATWDQFNPPLPGNVIPTVLGQKYGISLLPPLHKAGKSGLTPLSPLEPFSLRQYSDAEQLRICHLHTYQRVHLEGFTARELEDLGCIDVTDAKESTIDGIPLHPLYHRDNWLNSAQDGKVGHTVPGLWQAKNDAIWDLLLPCLKMASAFLSSKTCLPWFDALTCGERRLITEIIPAEWAPLYTFHTRPPQAAQAEMDAGTYQGADYLIMSPTIRRKIKFAISTTLPRGTQGSTGNVNTVKPTAAYPGYIGVNLSTQLFGPLLRTDLSTSERLATQFKAAKTILHETSHALQNLVREFVTNGVNSSEPFFEDERIAEVGYSMERALFEGNLSMIGFQGRKELTSVPPSVTAWGIPVMGLTVNTYPNWQKSDTLRRTMIKTNDRRTLEKRPHKTNFYNHTDFDDDLATGKEVDYTTWPIPIHYISQFHSLDFWLSTLGTQHQHLHIPRTIGKRKTRTAQTIIAGPTFLKYLHLVPETTSIPIPVTAQAQKALNDEEAIKAYAIRAILRNRVDWEQVQNWTHTPKAGFTKYAVGTGSLPVGVSVFTAEVIPMAGVISTARLVPMPGVISTAGDAISPGSSSAFSNTASVGGTAFDDTMQAIGIHPGLSPQDPVDAAFHKREALPIVVDSAGDTVMSETSLSASSRLQNPGIYSPTTPDYTSVSGPAVTTNAEKRGTKRGADSSGGEQLEFGNGNGEHGHSAKKKKRDNWVGATTGKGTTTTTGNGTTSVVEAGVGMNMIRGAPRGGGTPSTRSCGGTRRGRSVPVSGGARGGSILPRPISRPPTITPPISNTRNTTTPTPLSQNSTQTAPPGRGWGRGSLRNLRDSLSSRGNATTSTSIPNAQIAMNPTATSRNSTQTTPSEIGSGRGSFSVLRGSSRRNATTSISTSTSTAIPLRSTPLLGRDFSIPRAGLSVSSRGRGNISNPDLPNERGRGPEEGLKPSVQNDNGDKNANKGCAPKPDP